MAIDIDCAAADLCAKLARDTRDAGQHRGPMDVAEDCFDAFAQAGLTRAWLAEEQDGASATLPETFGIVWASVAAGAPHMLGDTLVASWALAQSGVDPSDVPYVSAPIAAAYAPPGARSVACVVPPHAQYVAIFGPEALRMYSCSAVSLEPLSEDRRDPLCLLTLSDTASEEVVVETNIDYALALGRTVRCTEMAAACKAVLDLAIAHVTTREQFGRPLSKFQAIQHAIARMGSAASFAQSGAMMAAQAAQVTVSASAAGEDSELTGDFSRTAAMAKCALSGAMESFIADAHQVHGAIGYTREYPLHALTRQLMAWRDSFGNETGLGSEIGRRAAVIGADETWAELTQR